MCLCQVLCCIFERVMYVCVCVREHYIVMVWAQGCVCEVVMDGKERHVGT
jgi:hypothetical protein